MQQSEHKLGTTNLSVFIWFTHDAMAWVVQAYSESVTRGIIYLLPNYRASGSLHIMLYKLDYYFYSYYYVTYDMSVQTMGIIAGPLKSFTSIKSPSVFITNITLLYYRCCEWMMPMNNWLHSLNRYCWHAKTWSLFHRQASQRTDLAPAAAVGPASIHVPGQPSSLLTPVASAL